MWKRPCGAASTWAWAPSAEASTTVIVIAINADTVITVAVRTNDRRRFRRSTKTAALHLLVDFADRKLARLAYRLFQNGEDLTLQRAVVPSRAVSQTLHDVIGGTLDGKVHGHSVLRNEEFLL